MPRFRALAPALPLMLTACALDAPLAVPEPRAAAASAECRIEFAGRTWCVRGAGRQGPGPNEWSADNVWVDGAGLHLVLRERAGVWYAAEVYTHEPLGFGEYEFRLATPVHALDPNVVLGAFTYSPLHRDGTHEIDIELARWGDAAAANLNYVVWPAVRTSPPARHAAGWPHAGASTHAFTRQRGSITFRSTAAGLAREWRFDPPDARARIPQEPLPFHFNLWLYQGRPPLDGRNVEVVIESFTFRR